MLRWIISFSRARACRAAAGICRAIAGRRGLWKALLTCSDVFLCNVSLSLYIYIYIYVNSFTYIVYVCMCVYIYIYIWYCYIINILVVHFSWHTTPQYYAEPSLGGGGLGRSPVKQTSQRARKLLRNLCYYHYCFVYLWRTTYHLLQNCCGLLFQRWDKVRVSKHPASPPRQTSVFRLLWLFFILLRFSIGKGFARDIVKLVYISRLVRYPCAGAMLSYSVWFQC